MAADQPTGGTRRQFLKAAAVTSGSLLLGCDDLARPGADPGGGAGGKADGLLTPPESFPSSARFGLGVASGDVTAASAILWTRYDGDRPLALHVYEMDGDGYAWEAVFDRIAPQAGFVHFDVTGLNAGRRYRYVFTELEGDTWRRSAIGQFRAAIADDAVEPLVIGATACNHWEREWTPLERAGERADLDLFLFLGDTAYCDGAKQLHEYRERWGRSLDRSGGQQIRAATSALATWDDHEVSNNWNPELISDSRLAAATRAFFDHQPLRRDPAAPDRIWRRVRWGHTVDIFCLDCRGERKPSTILTGAHQYISPAQMTWLQQGLADSPAVFKLIMNSVPISDFPLAFDAYKVDRWEAYSKQRKQILQFIDDESITGVIWVSGDFHLGSVQRVAKSGPGANQLEVLAGPGAQKSNLLVPFLEPPQFDFATGKNNYTAFHLDPANGDVRIVFHDGAGESVFDQVYAIG